MRNILTSVAGRGGAGSLLRRWRRAGVGILAYHGVDGQHQPVVNFDGLQMDPKTFAAQMETLARRYVVKPLSEIVRTLLGGEGVESNAVAITFDDGYRNNLCEAAPILKRLGLPATVFVTTGYVDGACEPWWYRLRLAVAETAAGTVRGPGDIEYPIATVGDKVRSLQRLERQLKRYPYRERDRFVERTLKALNAERTPLPYTPMGWGELTTWCREGFDVAPHTMHHVSLGVEPPAVVREEISGSARRLQEKLGAHSPCFAYPYGSEQDLGGPEVADMLRAQGIVAAVTTVQGVNGGDIAPYRLKRLNVSPRHQGILFEALLAGWL